MSTQMAETVAVFDFDDTIINCDSDAWVASELGCTELFAGLLQSLPWNAAAIRMVRELQLQGRSVDEIAVSLQGIPLSPHTAAAIKSAYALGCELWIVSDANTFFIETVLKHHGIAHCFTGIRTNPSHVDEDGELRIFPFHDFTSSSHGCSLCPPNLCKGVIVEEMKASAMAEGKKRFIYLGDGKGDYCPCVKLSEGDIVMPRKNYPLWGLINGNPDAVRAQVHEWSDEEELGRVLLRLVGEPCTPPARENAAACRLRPSASDGFHGATALLSLHAPQQTTAVFD